GLAHTASLNLLFGVFGGLIILTILTVAVTAIDLGSQGNFIVAMIIATIKAGMVMAFFMHMLWDSKFNVTVFVSSFLFVLLFLSMSLTDRSEYQDMIDSRETVNKAADEGRAEREPRATAQRSGGRRGVGGVELEAVVVRSGGGACGAGRRRSDQARGGALNRRTSTGQSARSR